MTAKESKKLTETEHINLRRETKILNASSTVFGKVEDVKVHNFQYYYSTSQELLRAIIADVDKESNENKSSIAKADVVTAKVIVDGTENIKIEDYSERDNSGWHDYKYDWCMAHLY